MGVMGYKTPKIDRLAKEGARRWRDCKQRVDFASFAVGQTFVIDGGYTAH